MFQKYKSLLVLITLLPLTRFVMYLSDRHKLIVTVLRSTFGKEKSKKMFYRCYKTFDNKRFEAELQKKSLSVSSFESFCFAFRVNVNQFAPLKKRKLLQNNNQPFMKKTLRKAIMKRSKLRNKVNEK